MSGRRFTPTTVRPEPVEGRVFRPERLFMVRQAHHERETDSELTVPRRYASSAAGKHSSARSMTPCDTEMAMP